MYNRRYVQYIDVMCAIFQSNERSRIKAA